MENVHHSASSHGTVHRRRRQIHFGVLFSALILYILASPWFDTIGSLAGVALSLLLIAAAYSTVESGNMWPPVAIFGAALAFGWLQEALGLEGAAPVSRVLYVGVFIYAVVRVFRYVIHARKVTFNVLMAGISTYLLIGLAWTMFYLIVWGLMPDAFSGAVTATADAGVHTRELLYYSFVSLTTVGYGDITAVSPLARALSVLEVLSGVLYLGVLVARLVSMYSAEASGEESSH